MGSLLVTQFQLAAMSRADTPLQTRVPFHLYVDEYHNFATDSFASILSEARKYGLSLTLVSQYTAQTRPDITNAVFGNVGTVISFRVGEADATMLARQFGEDMKPTTLTELPNHRVVMKTQNGNGFVEPFRVATMEPLTLRSGRRQLVIARSRERFSTKRDIIESRIRRWIGERTSDSPSNKKSKGHPKAMFPRVTRGKNNFNKHQVSHPTKHAAGVSRQGERERRRRPLRP